jgi:hypothetical protein
VGCLTIEDFLDLPGAELVSRGLDDLSHGRESEEAALVSMGAPRLALLGLEVPDPLPDGKAVLWSLLERRVGQDAAHARFNALQRRLVSFERALACVSR